MRTIFVHVWQPDEGVYVRGVPDPNYQPVPRSGSYVRALASATGGQAFSEHQFGRILETARHDLGSGPTAALTRDQQQVAMAPWIAALAFLPLGFLLWRRNL